MSQSQPSVNLAQLVEGIERRMQTEVEMITKQYGYGLEKGVAREELIVNFLRNFMPSNLYYGPGLIFTSDGSTSLPQDIVIFDHGSYPMFPMTSVSKLFPVEGVRGVIQVKSILDPGEIKRAVQNLASAKKLLISTGNRAIGDLVAFGTDYDRAKIRSELEQSNVVSISPYLAIDRLYLLGRYVIAYLDQERHTDLRAQTGAPIQGIETANATLLHLYRHLVSSLMLPSGTLDDFRHYLDSHLTRNFATF